MDTHARIPAPRSLVEAGSAKQDALDKKALAWSRAHRTYDFKGRLLTRYAAVASIPNITAANCGERVVHIEAATRKEAGEMVINLIRTLYPEAPGFKPDYYNLRAEEDDPAWVLRFVSGASALEETYSSDHILCFSHIPPPFRMKPLTSGRYDNGSKLSLQSASDQQSTAGQTITSSEVAYYGDASKPEA